MNRNVWITSVLVCLQFFVFLKLQAAAADPVLKEIIFEKTSSNEERVFLVLNGEYLPETFGMEGKRLRLVCDFADMQLGEGVRPVIKTGGDLIKRVRVGLHQSPAPKVRVVLDLATGHDYDVQQRFFERERVYSITVKTERNP